MVNGNRRDGFTLVELLVVISIIALLLAILMPTLGKARDQAQMTVCRAHQNQLSTALMLFTQDKGRFPLVYNQNSTQAFNWTTHWWHNIRPYFSEKSLAQGTPFDKGSSVYRCPSKKTGKEYTPARDDMRYNDKLGTRNVGVIRQICSYGMYQQLGAAKQNQVVRPSDCVAITDIWSCWSGDEFGPGFGYYSIDQPSNIPWKAPPARNPKSGWPNHRNENFHPTERHNMGTNIAWADGHVSWMKAQDLYAKTSDSTYGTNKYFTFSWDWSAWNYANPGGVE